jgi:hypothetical protein
MGDFTKRLQRSNKRVWADGLPAEVTDDLWGGRRFTTIAAPITSHNADGRMARLPILEQRATYWTELDEIAQWTRMQLIRLAQEPILSATAATDDPVAAILHIRQLIELVFWAAFHQYGQTTVYNLLRISTVADTCRCADARRVASGYSTRSAPITEARPTQ